MTKPEKKVTFRDIARECGVSPTTVSLALRNHPRISKETTERVKAAVERLHYTCNPMVSALMSSMGRSSSPSDPAPLAAIYTHSEKTFSALSYPKTLWDGISRRAEELGFPIERFFLDHQKIDSKRITEILVSRGITGLIIPPAFRGGSHLSINWNLFSAIAIGYSMLRPNLHRVCHDQYQGIRIALKRLYSRGYRRPGLVFYQTQDLRSLYSRSSGFYGHEHRRNKKQIVPVLECSDPDSFLRWYEKHKPDAIVGTGYDVIEQAGLKCPEDVGFVSLGYDENRPEVAGIDEQVELLGAAAVDHLVQLLYYNKRGVPEVPSTILIPPKWRDGASLPNLRASAKA